MEKAKKGNNTLKIAQQDVFMAKGDFNQTNAMLLPTIGISHTGITTTNPLLAFGSKLNQEIVTQADFNPDVLNNHPKYRTLPHKLKCYSLY